MSSKKSIEQCLSCSASLCKARHFQAGSESKFASLGCRFVQESKTSSGQESSPQDIVRQGVSPSLPLLAVVGVGFALCRMCRKARHRQERNPLRKTLSGRESIRVCLSWLSLCAGKQDIVRKGILSARHCQAGSQSKFASLGCRRCWVRSLLKCAGKQDIVRKGILSLSLSLSLSRSFSLIFVLSLSKTISIYIHTIFRSLSFKELLMSR